ncbi:MAG: TldD/PmbA family protein [Candidatus Thorarchaeota archaeon]
MSDDLLSRLRKHLDETLKLGADEVELFAQRTSSKEVNIESNNLKSAVSGIIEGIGIRVLRNKSIGFAYVNSLNPERVSKGLRNAVSIAGITPTMEHYTFSEPKSMAKVDGIYDSNIKAMTMDDIIERSMSMLKASHDVDSRVRIDSGSFSGFTTENAIVTSSGVEATELRSTIFWSQLALAVDGDDVGSFDYDYGSSTTLKDGLAETMATDLAKSVVRNLGAEKVDSVDGPAIISPGAVSELIGVIVQSASASNIQAGSSYLQDRLGEDIAVEELTIIDDGTLKGMSGTSAFDREGVPHSKCPLIENGAFRNILYDVFTANKESLQSTGHAAGSFRVSPTISSTNLDVVAGTAAIDDMIGEIKEGILIPRISAFPNPVSGDFSGPIKGGQLIKNGEIVATLKEVTITGNLFEGLKNITGISKERKVTGTDTQTITTPYIRIDGMKFAC